MFTGIIEETGRIQSLKRGRASAVISVGAENILEDLRTGDSVAVNGVCLTVTSLSSRGFTADVMHETLDRSSLGSLGLGSPVNLERALQAGGRLGGHIVSGHIDGTGRIAGIRRDDNAIWYTIKTTRQILRYMVEKGSVAIDGISLTVARISGDGFSVSVIPHTAGLTALSCCRIGNLVNLENDCVAKYVERLLGGGKEVKEGESFCANCGSEIQRTVNKTEKESGTERIEQGKEKKGNKRFFIFGGIGGALILFGGIIWGGTAKNTGREPDKNFPSISNESVSSKTFDFKVDRAWATDTIKCPEEQRDRFVSEYLSPVDENAIFYIVEFTFTNTSDQAIDERPVIRLVDSYGIAYERDEEVTTYTKQGGTSPDYSVYDQGIQSEPMAPGLSLKGQCTFVIAKDRLDHNGSVTCSRPLLDTNSVVEWLTGFNFGAEESVSVSLGGVQENNKQESYGDVSSETEETEFSANPSERETTELASSQDNGQLETEDSTYSNEDTGNESVNNQPQEKSITGVYTLELGNEGGAELEITYSSDDDSFLVYFSGNYGDQSGETKGYLVAHTDGTDGIWEYYEYSAYEAGNYVPSMQLEYDAADTITVTSLDGQSFGGMDFPGFDGTYERTAEYSMP